MQQDELLLIFFLRWIIILIRGLKAREQQKILERGAEG